MERVLLFCVIITTNPLCLFSIHFEEIYKSDEFNIVESLITSKSHLPEECSTAECRNTAFSSLRTIPGHTRIYQDILNNRNLAITSYGHTKDTSTSSAILEESVGHDDQHLTTDEGERKGGPLYFENNLLAERPKRKLIKRTKNQSEIFIGRSFHYQNCLHSELLRPSIEPLEKESKKTNSAHLQELKIFLQKRFSFLLLNSTVEQHSLEANLNNIYEIFRNSDVSRILVKLLQDKLDKLNKNETSRDVNTSDASDASTQTPTTSKKPSEFSKWSIVREFFLTNKSKVVDTSQQHKTTTTSNNFDPATSYKNKNSAVTQSHGETKARIDNTPEFSHLMENFYPGNVFDFLSANTKRSKNEQYFDQTIGDDTFEVFDINLPYNVEKDSNIEHLRDYEAEQSTSRAENIERTFKEEDKKSTLTSTEVKKPKSTNQSIQLNKKQTIAIKNFTTPQLSETNKVASLPHKKKISETLSDKLTNLFVWHKNNTSSKEKKPFILNEQFLLSLNSKRNQKDQTDNLLRMRIEDENTNNPDENYALSYPLDYSGSSDIEDLYNNSIVFLMHKGNSPGLKKDGKWNGFLDFFHIAKAIPCPKGKNPCIDSSNKTCTVESSSYNEYLQNSLANETESNTEKKQKMSTVRLPPELMPEALEGRQLNLSDVLFYDDSFEPKISHEEYNTTKNAFPFFFK